MAYLAALVTTAVLAVVIPYLDLPLAALVAAAGGVYVFHLIEERDTRMSKPNRKRFRLSEIRNKAAAKTGDVIELETDSGEEFSIPAPGFWPDEATDLMGKNREVELATVLLGGPEAYARFKAHGGRAQDVALVIQAHAEDQGVTSGESSAS